MELYILFFHQITYTVFGNKQADRVAKRAVKKQNIENIKIPMFKVKMISGSGIPALIQIEDSKSC